MKEIVAKNNAKKSNVKLYKLYKPLAFDLLFYYAISYLFLTNIKHFSTSQILFADAFYPLFKIFLQIIASILIPKFGKRRGLILGNLSLVFYLIMTMGATSILSLIFANIFCALGFVLKDLCETNMLYDSIEKTKDRNSKFSKIDGKSTANHYYINAVTSIATGFLYVINPYIPLIISTFIMLLNTILAYHFVEIKECFDEEKIKMEKTNFLTDIKKYGADTLEAFKYIKTSKRLCSLIIFNAIFHSITFFLITARRSLMSDINISSKSFGIIFAILGLVSGFASSRATAISKKHKNHTLEFLANIYSSVILLSGLAVILDLPAVLMYFFVLIAFTLQFTVEGPYLTIINTYLSSFANSQMRIKISSANLIIQDIVRTLLSFVFSFVLNYISTASSLLILGCISFIIFSIILLYMKDKVGLKPEEYPENDVKFSELKIDKL